MEVKSCRRCRALFHHVVGPTLCEKCKRKDEDDFQKVKDYLYDNPGASMTQVCTDVDVTVRQVQQYLRDGRLTVAKDSPLGIECERCKVRISTGRYCEECTAAMTNQFSATTKGMKKDQADKAKLQAGARMRYLNKEEIKRKR